VRRCTIDELETVGGSALGDQGSTGSDLAELLEERCAVQVDDRSTHPVVGLEAVCASVYSPFTVAR
jgi:hypothetical protein